MAKNKLSAPVTIVNGVKYFKLVSPYEGDYTKNCGLLGNEIDENFFFLRSNDIENMSFDENKNLILTRVDGEVLSVNIAQEYGEYSFEFDKDRGTIIITQPDGDVEELEGFLVEGKDIHVPTDETISGLGTLTDPLRINPTLITGQYAPVEALKVLGLGEQLPDGDYLGQRFLTKETIDDFGKMYTMREVQAIADQIKQTGWRVPTIEDWNDLLNTIECPADKNHSHISGWHGRIAGKALKSRDLWVSEEGNDDFFFTVLPTGIYPNRPDSYDDNSLYITAGFWSQTKSAAGDYYAKIFENEHDDVKETTFNGDARLSLRLVKDGLDKDGKRLPNYYEALYDVNDVEVILGQTTPVVAMPSDRSGGYTLWTRVNMSVMNGVRPEEWSGITGTSVETAYYISVWNGEIWEKRQMRDGETVVIADYNGEYQEWKLLHGELVSLTDDVTELVKELISAETARAISAETALQEQIDAEVERAISAETILQEEIEELAEALSAETERAISAETILQEEIDAEVERAISAETELWEAIGEIDDNIQELAEAISAETARAISAETALQEQIDEQGEQIEELSAYTEAFTDSVNQLANEVIGVEGSVASGFSVDFFKATWVPSTKEEVEEHPYEELVDEIPDPETWTGADYIIVHFVETHPGRDDEYMKISSTNHYISDAETIVDAIRDLDSKVYDEIEDLKAEDEILQEEIDNEIERATSAETELRNDLDEEIERAKAKEDELFANDIKTEDYELGINGVELHRNGGEDPILITFNANFGGDDEMPKPSH